MRSYKYIQYIPIAGVILFLVLFTIAAILYTGGTYLDASSPRFDVIHNYWCDLLNEKTHNGNYNASRVYSITATIVLCLSLIAFWINVPYILKVSFPYRLIIQICGTLSMLIGMLIFTPLHSEAITFAGFFGGIAFLAVIAALYKIKWYKLFCFGIVCLILGIISFTIYKTRIGLIGLPLVQKITLLCCLAWILLVDLGMRRVYQTENKM